MQRLSNAISAIKHYPRITFILCCLGLSASVFIVSCDKEKEVVYGVENVPVLPPSANKNKLKSEEQYVAVLHANLFEQALSANDILDISSLIMSVGDKDVIHDIIISNFMNKSGVLIPTNAEMRVDSFAMGAFVEDAYQRFFIRPPTQIEKSYLINYLKTHDEVTPELVYFAMATSNEYYFY
jgi:hypothetical protein